MWLVICESVLVNKAIKTYQLCKEICSSHVNDLRQSYVKTLRSSPPELFLGKGVLKTCSKFTGEHPCQSVVSIKLLCVVKQLYWDHTLVWMFSCKFTACFQNNFLWEHFGRARIWKIPCQILSVNLHGAEWIQRFHCTKDEAFCVVVPRICSHVLNKSLTENFIFVHLC